MFFFFSIFFVFFFLLNLFFVFFFDFSFFLIFACVSFHFFFFFLIAVSLFFPLFFLLAFLFFFLVLERFFTFGQVEGNACSGRSRHRPTNQSFRVCKVNLATLKVAQKHTIFVNLKN